DPRRAGDADTYAARVIVSEPVRDAKRATTRQSYAAGPAVAQEETDAARARKVRQQRRVVGGRAPRCERDEHTRVNGTGLVLQAVSVAELRVLVGVQRLDRSGPWLDVLVEEGGNAGDRMQVEVSADVGVAEAGTKQQRRRVQCAAGDDDR